MPQPRGKLVNISGFVDSNHTGNVITHQSHTGELVFVNMVPVQWYGKK